MEKTVAITTLGCKTNQFESAAMTEILGREGYRVIPFGEPADIYVINTCTVTARTDAESRKLIRRARRQNPSARIVVTGCYAQVAPEELQALPGVELVIGNTEKRGIAGLLGREPGEQRVVVSDISRQHRAEALSLESFSEHTRAFLQVQNGCDARCAYCIVPIARGPSRSVPPAEVLAGIRTFCARGFREVVLTGIHVGSYGLDLQPSTSLAELLSAIVAEGAIDRIRLGSVEPTEFPGELIDLLAASPAICPHLHIPLQSGSDPVLERMERRYTAGYFREVVRRLCAAIPGLTIGCDVIAGFPGETEDEFAESCRLIESLPIAYLHVFPFSSRRGTAAATMAGHLPPRVVKERAEQLRRLGEEKRHLWLAAQVGRDLPVLVQERQGDGLVRGLARNYATVVLPGGDELLNREVAVRVVRVDGGELRGELAGSEGAGR